MSSVVNNNKQYSSIRILRILVIVSILGLASGIYYFPIRNQVPSGVDSSVYINDVRWILANHRLPQPNQALTHGIQSYPSPGTDIILTSLVLITGMTVIKAFTWYQLLVIVLLFFTTYLVGRLYSRRLALLFIIALIGSFSLYRLFIGSTVSNLMAFSIINLIFYFSIILSRASRKIPYVILVVLLFFLLYLFHSYLTAPIFIFTYFIYLLLLLAKNDEFRKHMRFFLRQRSRWLLLTMASIFLGVMVLAFVKYWTIGLQALQAFTTPSTTDKFQYNIEWNQLGGLLGQPLWNIAMIGMLVFLARRKENINTWKVFPLLWIVVLWILLQSFRLGVHFYYERLVFLAGVVVAFFVAITVDKGIRSRAVTPLLVSIFLSTMVISGTMYMVNLFKASNDVGDNQLAALELLAKKVTSADLVLSNNNGVAQTRHDVIVTDANFRYFPSLQKNCGIDDLCKAFTQPGARGSLDILKSSSARYILLLKPNVEANTDLDLLKQKYSVTKNVKTVYTSNDASLFYLE